MEGFFIKSLSLMTTLNEVESVISFKKGLNVVTGPSNTGKSFAFECIDYVFGKKELSIIPEAIKYDAVVVEIETIVGDKYTIKRKYGSNEILILNDEINQWNESEAVSYSSTHDANSDNISKFLLELSGISPEIKIYRNTSKQVASLSFRSLSDWVLVDENEIISKKDMLQGVAFPNTILHQGILLYLLDDVKADLEKNTKNNKEIMAKIDGNIEVYEFSLKSLEERKSNLEKIIESKSSLDIKNYETYIEEFNILSNKIESLKKDLETMKSDISKLADKIRKNDMKLDNFKTLRKQYLSDIDRLNSIIENSSFVNSLENHPCPLCNNEIKTDNSSVYLDACIAEVAHIEQHIKGLDSLTEDIASSIQEYKKEKNDEEGNASLIIEEMDEYAKELNHYKIKIDDYILYKQELNEYENIELRMKKASDNIKQKQDEKTKSLNYKPLDFIGNEVISSLETYLTNSFKEINSTIDNVLFTKNLLDIIINGKNRRSNGKGVRALYKSLFFYYFWKYLRNTSKPHFSFMIFDSPLTSYKEKSIDEKEKNEEIAPDMQEKFFKVLSKEKNQQIIIFENKEVPFKYKEEINIIEFTRNSHKGRYGFIM